MSSGFRSEPSVRDPSPPPDLDSWIADYGAELRRHIRRMLDSDDDAEEILQEVWMAAASSPPDTGPGSNVRAWLYRVATNGALDRLARERRRSEALAVADPERLSGSMAPPGVGEGERLRRRIRSEVARLPFKQREAVWLRWVEEMEYPAVARRLDCSVESARSNVYHGLQRLRRTLADLHPDGEHT